MRCDRFEEEMIDVAAGTPASTGLKAHLADCLPCRRRLDEGRRRLEDVDRVLAAHLREAPAVDVAARVAARLANEETRGAWRPVWFAATAAGLGAAMLVSWIARRPAIDEHDERRVARSTETVARPSPLAPMRDAPAPHGAVETRRRSSILPAPRAGSSRRAAVEDGSVAEAVVLVPPGQDQAIRQFVAGLQGRMPPLRPLLLGATRVESPAEAPALIEIPLLEARPLDDAADPSERSE